MNSPKIKLSTEPYKGVRDFYPEDMFIQNHIFNVMRKTAEQFGYEEYSASILEPTDLYRAKSGEDMVSEETYSFKDRGDREVTLRPEMTPTVARMVAGRKRELAFPLRWYSIPNLFRYENPQRGRQREHFQLNVDYFGPESALADIEIINTAWTLMKNFGARDLDFEIRLNSRKIVKELYAIFGVSAEDSQKLSRAIDKKHKISNEAFKEAVEIVLGKRTDEFIKILQSNESLLEKIGTENQNVKDLISLLNSLEKKDIKNVRFDPTLMRGFDYYTGVIFEIFDTNPENKRALFGGGRYDDLLDIFGAEKMPAVGFGMGDVTIRDFLETRSLLPKYKTQTDLYICILDEKFTAQAEELAEKIRKEGVKVAVDFTGRKVGDQLKTADKQKIPFTLCIGENEIKTNIFKIKNMHTREENGFKPEEIASYLTQKPNF